MRLYHGSNQIIRHIDLSKSKEHKDFGSGFYLTQNFVRAIRMARRTTAIEAVGEPEVTPFLFYEKRCSEYVKIKVFEGRTAEWALFVMENRDRTKLFQHDYDIVIGPVADSRVDPVLREYKRKHSSDYRDTDSLKELAEQLKYPGEDYIQYCFCTQRGIEQLIVDL